MGSPYWLYIKEENNRVQGTDQRNKENEKNYTRASSHSDIGDLYLAFALRITKANSLLKCWRQVSGLG